MSSPETDLDVVRDPRPARREAVDHPRAGATGRPEPAPDLAAHASKLYEEPKKLVAHGLARAEDASVGRRPRTRYTITARGRRALAAWVREPGAGPSLEFEQLRQDPLRRQRHEGRGLANLARHPRVGAGGERGEPCHRPRLPRRAAASSPSVRPSTSSAASFLTAYYVFVAQWVDWAIAVVEAWPDDVTEAPFDLAVARTTVRMVQSGSPAQSS